MREGVWTIIGAIAGVLGVIFAIWLFWQGRLDQSKKLGIELIAQSTLVNESVPRKQQIAILYDGRNIPNYAILQFRVANTGGQVIRQADYEEQLFLSFSNVSEVLGAEQVSSDPKQLQTHPQHCSPDCQSVSLQSSLLNPKDWYIVEVSAVPQSGKKIAVEPRGRIVGVKQIEFRESISPPTERKLDFTSPLFVGFFSSMLVLLGSSLYTTLKPLLSWWPFRPPT